MMTSERWETTVEDDGGRRRLGWGTALDGLLLLGIVVWLGRALELELGWPFFVIIPGPGLLGLGLGAPGRLGEVLATVGGVVTMPPGDGRPLGRRIDASAPQDGPHGARPTLSL